jgi:hypothetical protein
MQDCVYIPSIVKILEISIDFKQIYENNYINKMIKTSKLFNG